MPLSGSVGDSVALTAGIYGITLVYTLIGRVIFMSLYKETPRLCGDFGFGFRVSEPAVVGILIVFGRSQIDGVESGVSCQQQVHALLITCFNRIGSRQGGRSSRFELVHIIDGGVCMEMPPQHLTFT